MILALLSALAVALNGLAGGFASRKIGVALVLGMAAPVSLSVAVLALTLDLSMPTSRGILVGLIAGLSGGLGILMSYRALQIGPIGIASAITACSAVTVASVWGLATQGGASVPRVLAMVLCLVAVVLVSYRRGTTNVQLSATFYAAVAGIVFGFFQVLMNLTDESDGWWPLIMVRAGVMVVAWIFVAYIIRTRGRPAFRSFPRWVWWVPAIAGTMDALGNIFLILALRVEELSVVAVMTSVTPGLTAILGWLVLAEKLSLRQVAGLGTAIVALVLAGL